LACNDVDLRGGKVRLGPALTVALAALLAAPGGAAAAVPPVPIPEGSTSAPTFERFSATPSPVPETEAPEPPRHPFMAPNGKSEIHVDAYQSGMNTWAGPLGNNMTRLSSLQAANCASHTFDAAGRVLTICVGLEGPRLAMFDPDTLELLAVFPLPPRNPSGGDPFSDFSGGGYFYLDDQDRAVIPTNNRQIWVVRETNAPGFELERAYDLSSAVTPDDKLFSALPDWDGKIWFVSAKGVVGTVDRSTGAVKVHRTGEKIGNSFAVDETGGVFIVTDAALYRFDPRRDGQPTVTWKVIYPNIHVVKPGQTQAGSGTTPDLMGEDYVSITDNADPMNVVVYRRTRRPLKNRLVCSVPVFEQGSSATDNSLITTQSAMVVENNYGYSGPTATQNGASVPGGVERVDLNADGNGCRKVWDSNERAPSVVPKLSRDNGLVYLYTKDPQADGSDTWYLTAVDFRTGATVYKRLAGEGLGYNNHYAPITIAEDASIYVGVLGGLVRLRDGSP
jgi:hypothetical protein